MTFVPAIDPAIWTIAPGFRALSVTARRKPGGTCNGEVAKRLLAEAVDTVQAGGPVWAGAHLAAWDEVFRKFGAKPQRTPCSARSLRDRVLKTGTLGAIDPVVDVYNAVSLKFAVPVGGENLTAYRGAPRLVVADGSEIFDTMKNGEPAVERPDPGEVIWRDAAGVTCRRWNWRQGARTRIEAGATSMWFVLESLPEMPVDALQAADVALAGGLDELFGDAQCNVTILQQE